MNSNSSRRKFLRLGALGLTGLLGGCVEVSTNPRNGNKDPTTAPASTENSVPVTTTSNENRDTDVATETTEESEATIDPESFESIETVSPETLPDPRIRRLISSEPKMVDIDHSTGPGLDTFTATVQNTGDDGLIHVRLYWKKDASERDPLIPVAEKSVFFNSGERRSVELHAKPSSDAEGYEIRVRTATRGASIINHGVSGNVRVELHGGGFVEGTVILDSRTVFIRKGSTKDVEFDGEHTIFGNRWEIEVSPAE